MIDINQYCLCINSDGTDQSQVQQIDPISTIVETPIIQREKKIKKKNKAKFIPFIQNKVESTLGKALEIIDKDEIIFK